MISDETLQSSAHATNSKNNNNNNNNTNNDTVSNNISIDHKPKANKIADVNANNDLYRRFSDVVINCCTAHKLDM